MTNFWILFLLVGATLASLNNDLPTQPIVNFMQNSSLVCSGVLLTQSHIITSTHCSNMLAEPSILNFKIFKLDFHIDLFTKDTNKNLTMYKTLKPIPIGSHMLPSRSNVLTCSKRHLVFTFENQTNGEFSVEHIKCSTLCTNKPDCKMLPSIRASGMPVYCASTQHNLFGIVTGFRSVNCTFTFSYEQLALHSLWLQFALDILRPSTSIPELTASTAADSIEDIQFLSSKSDIIEQNSKYVPFVTSSVAPETSNTVAIGSANLTTVAENYEKTILCIVIGVLSLAVVTLSATTVWLRATRRAPNSSYHIVNYANDQSM